MSKEKLKKMIIAELKLINDKMIIEQIYQILFHSEKNDQKMKLNDAQKKSINKGLVDVKKGRTISNNVANKMIEKLLSKG